MGKWLFKLMGLITLVASMAVGWVWMDYQSFQKAPLAVGDEGLRFDIAPGMTLIQVAHSLETPKVLSNARYLVWLARQRGVANTIKTGEYRVDPGTTPGQLLDRMVRGDTIQYAFTIVEGWSFQQLVQALDTNDIVRHTLVGAGHPQIMALLGLPDQHPEGRFLPDTYYFPRGTTDVDVLRRAYRAMEAVLSAEWEGRDQGLPFSTPYEGLILASIVEKETGLPEERPLIAGVFARRLHKGMRLQTDPTVIYGLGTQFDGNLKRSHLLEDGPYNTYRRAGLPPTPIALPGRAALTAAMHPAPGGALYFVARGDGGHVFSSTLAEHNTAVTRFQLAGRRGGPGTRPYTSKIH